MWKRVLLAAGAIAAIAYAASRNSDARALRRRHQKSDDQARWEGEGGATHAKRESPVDVESVRAA